MAYNDNLPRAEYTASASQTVFPFLFKIFTSSDIKVYQTPSGQDPDDVTDLLTLTTDYTVTINGDAGGEITLVSGATNGDKLTLLRSLDITRNIEYQSQGDLTADTLNLDQEYQTYLIADREAIGERYIKLSENAQGVSGFLPSPEALNVIRWNSLGTALENHTIGDDSVFINIYNVDNIAALLLVDPLVIPTVNVRGYSTANDGGGGLFNYDASQAAVNNGGTVINGWVRQYSGVANVKWFGAKGDGVTDDTAIFTLVAGLFNIVEVPYTSNSYVISSSLTNAATSFIFNGDSSQVTGTVTVQQLKAIFTDNGYINGIPIADELRDKKIAIVSGTLKQNATTRTQWDWIKDSQHEPIGVDDSTPAIATGTGLVINFGQTFSKTLSMVVAPDETLASNLGLTIGSSVGLSSMLLQASVSMALSAHVKFNGSTWDIVYGESQGGGNHESVINSVVASGANITINHDWIPGDAIKLTPHTNNGAVIPTIPCIKSNTDVQTVLNFVNYAGGFVNPADTTMSFNFTKEFTGKIYLDGGSAGGNPSGDVLDLDLGNIWFFGIMQI